MELSCDCKNIEINVAPPTQVTICNCFICSRYQSLWGYYSPGEVKITIGARGTNVYLRGDREIEFVRCANCGCITHYQTLPGDSDPLVAVNFRMMDQELLKDIPVRYHNGKEV
jgi:hypothetical protein